VEIAFWTFPLLFVVGIIAGFIDSIVGGGGLVTLPALLAVGIPPLEALGTNKLQSSFGSARATINYARAGLMDIRQCLEGMIITFLGSTAGTICIQHISIAILRKVIPGLLLLALLIFVFSKPKFGETAHSPILSRRVFHLIMGIVLGFYDGFFGPGTGSFWTISYVFLLGLELKSATAHTKAMNFSSNIASFLFFAISNHMIWGIGICMGVGQWIGATLGSHLVIKKESSFIRPIFISVVLAVTLKLLWDALALK
jgi:uncharacterized protein